jgi:pimeloyl-ACP methyl ester carboxylesterase
VAAALPELDGVRHSWVDANGVRIHVAEMGPADAPPLLLVHGWPQHWWCWHKVAPRLAERRRIVMPDLRGHGWSEAPRGGYDKEQLAADMIAVLDALELERVGYVGHDWGSVVGFIAALRRPERISELLAMSVPHPWPSAHDRRSPRRMASFLYQIPLSSLVGEVLVNAGAVPKVIESGAADGTFTEDDLAPYGATWSTRRGGRVTVQMYRTFVLRELGPILAGRYSKLRLEQPARLLVGEHDPVAGGARLDGHEANAPRLEVEWVPGAAHFLPEERPELVVQRAHELFGS